jgi:hypothetical protein
MKYKKMVSIQFAIGLHFVILMLYFLVLFFFNHFWILPLFTFLLTLESYFMIDNSNYCAIIFQENVLLFNRTEKLWVSLNKLEFRKKGFFLDKQIYRRAKCLEREFFSSNKKYVS